MADKPPKYKQRTDYTQLPAAEEVIEMLKQESQRKPPKGKVDVHYPSFETVIDWLKALGISTDVFSKTYQLQEFVHMADSLLEEVVVKTLSVVRKEKTIPEWARGVSSYLGEEEVPNKVSIILVLGSRSLTRIEKGAELWKKGIGQSIFIVGGDPHWVNNDTTPEAVVFARHAVKLGVPKDKVLVEVNSFNIADNIKTFFNIADNSGINISGGVVIVAPWFALRSAWAFSKKLNTEQVHIFRVASDVGETFSKDAWFRNGEAIKVVFKEFFKMRCAVLTNTS